MITRVKVGGFKPETYIAIVYDNETMSLKSVLSSSSWFQAMKDEYTTLVTNNTWTLTSLPFSAHIIGCKWLF